MSRVEQLSHEFVEFIPTDLREGVLYVSLAYATATHRCCCGCGSEVVTPLSPKDWKMIFDGETVSLDPSIGNWSFPCQSHYWVRRNKVQWSRKWSHERIDAGRALDRAERGQPPARSDPDAAPVERPAQSVTSDPPADSAQPPTAHRGPVKRLRDRVSRWLATSRR